MAQSGLDSLLEALRQSGMNTDGVGSGTGASDSASSGPQTPGSGSGAGAGASGSRGGVGGFPFGGFGGFGGAGNGGGRGHGGSGSGDDNLVKAIAGGITKINIASDLFVAGEEVMKTDTRAAYFAFDKIADGYKDKLKYYMELFGEKGVASKF